jgi:ribonucleoside-diphosphate reductase alpha chain
MNKFPEAIEKILRERYYLEGENWEKLCRRVAKFVANGEDEYESMFYKMMYNLEFLPNSPTLMNAGTDNPQLAACFVLPVEDSLDKIFDTVKNTALIHKSGGGTGFNFSKLREEGAVVKSTNSTSSGAISFIEVIDAATQKIKQGGKRRGANMAVLNIDHPEIENFINVKRDGTRLNNFNISVGITNKFIEAVKDKKSWNLISPLNGNVIKTVDAEKLFLSIINSMYDNGEPGIIFLDTINNALPEELRGIDATNPCGEQPLLPNEACNLGSINLTKFYDKSTNFFDYEALSGIVRKCIIFLDKCIDVGKYPLLEIDKQVKLHRKIGLGVMGFADLLYMMEIPYNIPKARKVAEEIMTTIKKASNDATINNFNNALITTIAPTGTISLIAGVSSGIEPNFMLAYKRKVSNGDEIIMSNEILRSKLLDIFDNSKDVDLVFSRIIDGENLFDILLSKGIMPEIANKLSSVFITSHDISPEAHVLMQGEFQKLTDNAVSKTINFGKHVNKIDILNAVKLAHKIGCKGITVYRDGSRENQVLSSNEVEKLKEIPKRIEKKYPLNGITQKISTGCGSLYVTINYFNKKPVEIFISMGKAGGCQAAQLESIGRLASIALQNGVKIDSIAKQLSNIRCQNPIISKGEKITSCADAVAKSIIKINKLNKDNYLNTSSNNKCPDCGFSLNMSEGCMKCENCGWSKC